MDRTIGVVTKSDMLHSEDIPKVHTPLQVEDPFAYLGSG